MALVTVKQVIKNVASAGTAEALVAASTLANNVVIQAKSGNTGVIYVGTSSVSSSAYGVALTAGNSVSIEMPAGSYGALEIDLLDIYIDAGTSSDGVSIMYFQKA